MASLIRYNSFSDLKKSNDSKSSSKKKETKHKAEAESFLKLLSSANKKNSEKAK
jgi:hypothetical protein